MKKSYRTRSIGLVLLARWPTTNLSASEAGTTARNSAVWLFPRRSVKVYKTSVFLFFLSASEAGDCLKKKNSAVCGSCLGPPRSNVQNITKFHKISAHNFAIHSTTSRLNITRARTHIHTHTHTSFLFTIHHHIFSTVDGGCERQKRRKTETNKDRTEAGKIPRKPYLNSLKPTRQEKRKGRKERQKGRKT